MTKQNSFASLPPLGSAEALAPVARLTGPTSSSADKCEFPYTLHKGETLILDWGRKRTGWVSVAGKGAVDFSYGSDLRFFEIYDSESARRADFTGDRTPTFFGTKSRGAIELSDTPRLIHPRSAALRYLRLQNKSDNPVRVSMAVMKPSEFPAPPTGRFECSDETLDLAWRMGIDTVHLCTQPGEESQTPVFGPFGNGYVQWDGCRRDREIWGGDLRTGSLAWYYGWQDQSPIANSLYVVLSAQHVGCDENGLFPGSGSSHLKYYEWAFWEVTNLWEYILHTGDQKMTRFAARVVPMFLGWCEKKYAEQPDRWIHTDLSWMYSFTRTGRLPVVPLPALQTVAAIGLRAMEDLLLHLGQAGNAKRAHALRSDISERFHSAFWDEKLQSYPFFKPGADDVSRSDLCTNSWAILGNIVPPERRKIILDSLQRLHWRDAGSINVSPPYDVVFAHNDTIWPYANSYEVAARFYAGDVDGALEVLKRYVRIVAGTGHRTLFEMIYLDGSLPVQANGDDTLSFCHAWSAQGSWALQRYLLGIAPTKPGWREFAINPLPSPLEWVRGAIPTPFGPIEAEFENKKGVLTGKVTHPREIRPDAAQASPSGRIEIAAS